MLKNYSKVTVLILIVFGIYFPLIISGQVTNYDDHLLIFPIKFIKNFSDYYNAILVGNVLDIQPIRDLTYWIDLHLEGLFHHEMYYFTNVLLLIALSLVLKSIFEKNTKASKTHQWLLLLVFATSPLVMSSVGWIAARKHLLAAVFIFAATSKIFALENNKITSKDILFVTCLYLCSLLSHPINLFWPLFPFSYLFLKNNADWKKLILPLGLVFIIMLVSNVFYYKGLYVRITAGDGKFESINGLNIGLSILAVGRYFYSSLNPFDYLPTSYYEGAWQNIFGIILFMGFCFWIFKLTRDNRKKHYFAYLILFLVPLIPVTALMTRIFCSQTYLLSSILGLLIIIQEEFNTRFSRYIIITFIVLNIICSIQYSHILGDEEKIFNFAYWKEKTPLSISGKISHDIQNHEHAKVQKEIEQLKIYDEMNRFIPYFITYNIYSNPQLTLQEKIVQLEKNPQDSPYYFLILSLLYSNENDKDKFERTVTSIFKSPEKYIYHSYLDNEKTLAIYRVSCEKFHFEDQCKKAFTVFSKKVNLKNWNASLYSDYYRSLSSNHDHLAY